MFEEAKSMLMSRTIWGALVALMASGAGLAGYTVSAADQASILTLLTSLAGLAGSAVAIWGRIVATKRLGR